MDGLDAWNRARMGRDEPAPGRAARVGDASGSHLRIIIRDLETEVRVGLHPWERHPERPTRVVVNVELFAAVDRSLGSEMPEGIMDYDHIRTALRTWPGRPHTPLLETLLDELVGLCFQGPRVQACRVSIVKPDIFNEAGAAGVEVFMLRQDHRTEASYAR